MPGNTANKSQKPLTSVDSQQQSKKFIDPCSVDVAEFVLRRATPHEQRIKEIHKSFREALQDGLSPEELKQTEETLDRMMENLNRTVWHRMEE